MSENKKKNDGLWAILIIGGLVVGFVLLLMWSLPQYSVWQKGLAGKALLEEAKFSRQIAVEEAEAKKEAATSLAQAEVERAKGVAEANQIIGDSLKDNDGYLRYLWIMGLHDGSSEVIYIPTEGNMPILEATRHMLKPASE